jgi:hypothetical protein
MDKKNNGKFSKNKMLRSGVIFKNTLKIDKEKKEVIY